MLTIHFNGAPDFCKMRSEILLVLVSILLIGCRSHDSLPKPAIQITRVPPANAGGPAQLDYIEGRATGAAPGQQIVLYAHSGIWFIQPFSIQPFTKIQTDSKWKNLTHLGTEYSALLVEPGYHPATRLTALPREGNGVVAVAIAEGSHAASIVPKVIHFSGFNWIVRAAGSDRGGEPNFYDPANVWVDEKGYLHLRMGMLDGKWSCAEVNLTRSLGYGSYRFVVQDSAHLEPSAVLGMFLFDDFRTDEVRSELDIEMSRFGNPLGKNAQYVVQPYYVSENVARFAAPAGVLTHILRWQPENASFSTFRGAVEDSGSSPVSAHLFTSGVPNSASETAHIDLYDFHHARNTSQRPAEVVIERFEYLP